MTISGHSASMPNLETTSAQMAGPDDTTCLSTNRRPSNYQSTQSSSASTIRRQPPCLAVEEVDELDTLEVPVVNGRGPQKQRRWGDGLTAMWSIELENKGSVARDHLALERTYLAWLRTSLAFASIGVAVTQLFRLNIPAQGKDDAEFEAVRNVGKPLGVTFLGISILILFLGYQRYLQSQQWIIKGKFPASRGTVLLVSAISLVLMLASLIVIVVVQPAGGGS